MPMTKPWVNARLFVSGLVACCTLLSASGCLPNAANTGNALKNTESAATSESTSSQTIPTGPRSAKIKFRVSGDTGLGSFDAPAAAGTKNVPGSGHRVERLFNPDNSLLAASPSASSWPKWLSFAELGISGSSNDAAQNQNCARFSVDTTSSKESSQVCKFSDNTTFACGGPTDYFRVSEYDCMRGDVPTLTGNGGGSDGVFVRINLNRDTSKLGATENLMVVLEYQASTLNPGPANPAACTSSGIFDPTDTHCADMSWQMFLKHSASEVVQPFLLLVPPGFGFVDQANKRAGASVVTKQFFLPLASDSKLSVLQISRMRALSTSAPGFAASCNEAPDSAANSPLCLGMVLYSMTLYRM